MIIGTGNIARVLNDRPGAIFFASGISNSNHVDDFEAAREYSRLKTLTPTNLCLFYFSSISIAYKNSPYTDHKLWMETAVKRFFKNYNIIRIGNLDWDTNPNTFLNKMRADMAKGIAINILDEFRYMISKEQLTLLTDHLPLVGQHEINVFGRMAKVKDLL